MPRHRARQGTAALEARVRRLEARMRVRRTAHRALEARTARIEYTLRHLVNTALPFVDAMVAQFLEDEEQYLSGEEEEQVVEQQVVEQEVVQEAVQEVEQDVVQEVEQAIELNLELEVEREEVVLEAEQPENEHEAEFTEDSDATSLSCDSPAQKSDSEEADNSSVASGDTDDHDHSYAGSPSPDSGAAETVSSVSNILQESIATDPPEESASAEVQPPAWPLLRPQAAPEFGSSSSWVRVGPEEFFRRLPRTPQQKSTSAWVRGPALKSQRSRPQLPPASDSGTEAAEASWQPPAWPAPSCAAVHPSIYSLFPQTDPAFFSCPSLVPPPAPTSATQPLLHTMQADGGWPPPSPPGSPSPPLPQSPSPPLSASESPAAAEARSRTVSQSGTRPSMMSYADAVARSNASRSMDALMPKWAQSSTRRSESMETLRPRGMQPFCMRSLSTAGGLSTPPTLLPPSLPAEPPTLPPRAPPGFGADPSPRPPPGFSAVPTGHPSSPAFSLPQPDVFPLLAAPFPKREAFELGHALTSSPDQVPRPSTSLYSPVTQSPPRFPPSGYDDDAAVPTARQAMAGLGEEMLLMAANSGQRERLLLLGSASTNARSNLDSYFLAMTRSLQVHPLLDYVPDQDVFSDEAHIPQYK